jgi:hypothetical protein
MIDAADGAFLRGHTDRIREVRSIWRRARKGVATPDDVETLRRELIDGSLAGRKSYLINALYMAGERSEAIELVTELIKSAPEWDDLELALSLLHQWSPSDYARVALPLIRGALPDSMGTRSWAMLYAGLILRTGKEPQLLDELVRIVRDPSESELSKGQARWAIAHAAPDFDVLKSTRYSHDATPEEVESLIEQVRAHINTEGQR